MQKANVNAKIARAIKIMIIFQTLETLFKSFSQNDLSNYKFKEEL